MKNYLAIAVFLLSSTQAFSQISNVTSGSGIEAQKINQLIDKINELEQKTLILEQKIVPIGSVIAMAGNCPSGYRIANGDSLVRADFSALFSAIGTAHGSASATHFNIPDYRGRFLRGLDNGSRDPNSATRTAMNVGGSIGSNIGSIQDDAFQGHWHQSLYSTNRNTNSTFDTRLSNTGENFIDLDSTRDPISDGVNGTPKTSSETRPKNAYVNFCIKFN